MRNIVCFGDSNTWGFIPGSGERYEWGLRWTSILQNELKDSFRVVEEGLNGRITSQDHPSKPGRNASELLIPLLHTHSPIELLIIMLGTNDILYFPEYSVKDAARGIESLIDVTLVSDTGAKSSHPEILIVAPPEIKLLSNELNEICPGNPANSKGFGEIYKNVAINKRVHFFDSAVHVSSSEIDGVHLDADSHKKLGIALAECILKDIFYET